MDATGEPADRPYGERSASVVDAFRNYWHIATRLASAPAGRAFARSWNRAVVCASRGRGKYIDFLERAFGAEEMAVIEHSAIVKDPEATCGGRYFRFGMQRSLNL
jgi:uncharacterized glyoxalase superfamily protein PhnB